MPKGSNPNSQENLKLGSPKRTDGATRHNVRLKPETVALALELGDGVLGRGLDKMAEIIKDNKKTMTKTYQAELYNTIEDIDQFEEIVELMEETRHLLQQFIKKNKKNKEVMEEVKYILEEYKDLNLKV